MVILRGLSPTLLTLFWLAVTSHAASLFDSCTDGAGVRGVCLTIRDCDTAGAMLRRGNWSNQEREYLKKSECGMNAGARMVCCPLPRSLKARFAAPATLPPVGVCGKDTSDRIVGGEITKPDDFPWLARIQYFKPNRRFGFHCGGVLINERYVLTAAHCIHSVPSSWTLYKVRLGEYDTQTDNDCNYYEPEDCIEPHQDVLIASYYIHEDYFQENGADYNDIALIRLALPVTYTAFIQPICLPVTEDQKRLPTEGSRMMVAGWGQTETKSASQYKMFLEVPGWANDKCRDAFSSVSVDIIETQLCAGGEAGKDSCRGDSGGPLMKLERIAGKPAWFLKGIVSFGTEKCGTEDVPGVYSRISKYMDWVLENIEE
ncbi:hypothetical protein RP20_CCG016961 [Aedes albopictus]|nr:hypothetical protein RP20_CCG016961 [Aedes albopictus]